MSVLSDVASSPEMSLLNNQAWRLSHLYWIKDKSGNRVIFQPNWAQYELLKHEHTLNIILKARQLGVTTFHALMFLDLCIFTPNVHAAIIADAKVVAKEIFVDKVKYAYDNLPEPFKKLNPAYRDNAQELRFKNGSVFRVGTSMRGGTTQYLHITEFAKICQENPRKASEVMSGAINTVQAGQFICIESTARGREGFFYDICQKAIEDEKEGRELGVLDWKFWFFPWWKHPEYHLDGDVKLAHEHVKYFDRLHKEHGIVLADSQKNWYVKKLTTQDEYMTREYPSTAEESFESANEGFYFAKQLKLARDERRICHLPIDEYATIFSAWDIGWNDETAIWVFQLVGKEAHFVDYYENREEALPHYINWFRSRRYQVAKHYLPFDSKAKSAATGKSFSDFARQGGLKVEVLERMSNELVGIELARSMFNKTFYDSAKCKLGLKALDNFRKEWNEKLQCYRDRSLHDWSSHGAKAFIYACQAITKITTRSGLSADDWKKVRNLYI